MAKWGIGPILGNVRLGNPFPGVHVPKTRRVSSAHVNASAVKVSQPLQRTTRPKVPGWGSLRRSGSVSSDRL